MQISPLLAHPRLQSGRKSQLSILARLTGQLERADPASDGAGITVTHAVPADPGPDTTARAPTWRPHGLYGKGIHPGATREATQQLRGRESHARTPACMDGEPHGIDVQYSCRQWALQPGQALFLIQPHLQHVVTLRGELAPTDSSNQQRPPQETVLVVLGRPLRWSIWRRGEDGPSARDSGHHPSAQRPPLRVAPDPWRAATGPNHCRNSLLSPWRQSTSLHGVAAALEPAPPRAEPLDAPGGSPWLRAGHTTLCGDG